MGACHWPVLSSSPPSVRAMRGARAHTFQDDRNFRRQIMMLIEQTPVPDAALPVQEFKDHLRLGTGFADDGTQDVLLKRLLRAAMGAIEARIGKVLIARDFLYTRSDWRDLAEQALPVAPVRWITSVTVLDRLGAGVLIAVSRYVLAKDLHRPKLVASGLLLPTIPTDGSVEIVFNAGFGVAWADVPVDLRQAVLLLGAHYHDVRSEAGVGMLPFGVTALIERWRTIRVLGGGVS